MSFDEEHIDEHGECSAEIARLRVAEGEAMLVVEQQDRDIARLREEVARLREERETFAKSFRQAQESADELRKEVARLKETARNVVASGALGDERQRHTDEEHTIYGCDCRAEEPKK